jgi:hypothetical protein
VSLGIDKQRLSESLNRFSEDSVVSNLFTKLMGAVPVPVFWKIRLESFRSPTRLQSLLNLEIRVGRHTRIVYGSNGQNWTEDVDGWVTSDQEPIDDWVMRSMSHRERTEHLSQHMGALFHRLGPTLYEYDPRIGFNPAQKGALPKCPFLDPHEVFSRTGMLGTLLQEQAAHEYGQFQREVPEELLAGSNCPLCDSEIDGSRSYMWGGANMLWVHHECWRQT